MAFLTAEIQNGNGDRLSSRISKDNIATFDIVRGERYFLDLSYRFPAQEVNPATTNEVNIVTDKPFRLIDNERLPLNATSNNTQKMFTTEKYPNDSYGKIGIESESNEEDLLVSNAIINLRIVEKPSFWWEVFFYAVIFTMCAIFVGISLSDSKYIGLVIWDLSSVHSLAENLQGILHNLWPQSLAATIQALALFRLFNLLGKKVL